MTNEDLEEDLQLYNQLLQSNLLFMRAFNLEKQKTRLALKNSIGNVIEQLPARILEMSAEDFLVKCSDNELFDAQYNKELQLVDSSCLNLLGSLKTLFEN